MDGSTRAYTYTTTSEPSSSKSVQTTVGGDTITAYDDGYTYAGYTGDTTTSEPSSSKSVQTTTEQLPTVPTVSVKISTDISVATTITYSAALIDTSSEEYATQSANVQAIFQLELEIVASNAGGTLDKVTVTFSESTSKRRRRSSYTDVVITADYSFEVPAIGDFNSLTSAVSSSTSYAANSAIASSAGTYIDTSAVTSVSSSAEVQTDEDVTCGNDR